MFIQVLNGDVVVGFKKLFKKSVKKNIKTKTHVLYNNLKKKSRKNIAI